MNKKRKKIYIINHQILHIDSLLRLGSGDVTVILNTSILVTESHYWSMLMREIWTTWVISNLHKSLTKCLMTSLCTASSCFKSLLVFLYFTSLRIHTNGLCTPKHGLWTYSKCQFSRLPLLNPSQPLSLSVLQLMQQQALVAQSAYLSPVATVAAVQMQQLAALNPSGIIATPIASITPSSGNERQRCLALIRFLPEIWGRIYKERWTREDKITNIYSVLFSILSQS